jgi:hypothetical protein
MALWAALATGGLVALFAGALYAAIGECLGNEETYPPSWQWSPRREFCHEAGSPASRGYWALTAAPLLIASAAAFLWSRGRRWPGYFVSLCLLGVVFLPSAYIQALPYYPRDTTPVLHNPYLRVATETRLARACYAFGITDGYRTVRFTDGTDHFCVDLAPTPEALALALAPEYDQGATLYGLEWLGRTLTENGMEPGTEWEGLVVEHVYRLPVDEAREDATLIQP